jgi:hypothetical protein
LKPLYKYILLLLILNVFIAGSAYFLGTIHIITLLFTDIVILSLFFSIIAIITLIIFLRGQTKDPESQTLHSLVSVGLKFLLELVLALVWFFVAKKTSLDSVFAFFVIYLTLTLFSVLIILKTLKNKAL